MKAGTDAMILGAYLPTNNAKRILDIGTGTGILALMVAQRCGAEIAAVEADKIACEQATENFKNSSWGNRIKAVHSPIQEYAPVDPEKFDLIISNPPFFETNMKAKKESDTYNFRKNARSFESLDYEDLLAHTDRLLEEAGCFYVIIPATAADSFIRKAANMGLFLIENLYILSKEGQNPIRNILGLGRTKKPTVTKQLTIYENIGAYTDAYIDLTKYYYSFDMKARKQRNQKTL
jgi:tRNA1Val (adenine37-N6)-methyltransferase